MLLIPLFFSFSIRGETRGSSRDSKSGCSCRVVTGVFFRKFIDVILANFKSVTLMVYLLIE